MKKSLTTFIPKSNNSRLTKADIKRQDPNARYSGKTIYDKDGSIVRGPGFFVE